MIQQNKKHQGKKDNSRKKEWNIPKVSSLNNKKTFGGEPPQTPEGLGYDS